MTEWFDSHCHVDEEAFDEDREEVLSRMKANGVTSYGLTPKNVLLARLGISHFLKHMGHYETYFTGEDTQKELREYFKDQMEANKPGKRWRSEERFQMSAILLSVFTPNDKDGNVVLKA